MAGEARRQRRLRAGKAAFPKGLAGPVPNRDRGLYVTHRSPASLPAAIAPQHVGARLHRPKLCVLRGGELPDAIDCVWTGRQPPLRHCSETLIWHSTKELRY